MFKTNNNAVDPLSDPTRILLQWRECMNEDFPVSVGFSKEKGRFLRSTRFISAGEVLRDKAIGWIIHEQEKTTSCDHCGDSIVFPSSFSPHCYECLQVWYCCESCQKEAFTRHQHECALFKLLCSSSSLASVVSSLSSTHQTLFRFSLRLISQFHINTPPSPTALSSYPSIFDLKHLISNREYHSSHDLQEIYCLHRLINQFLIAAGYKTISEDEYLELVCIIHCNSIAFNYHPSGYGLWIVSSFINHSCDENVQMLASGGELIKFIALDDIPPDSELCFAYLDPHKPLNLRQKHFMEKYYFRCTCRLCHLIELEETSSVEL